MTALSVSTSSAASLRADALVIGVAKGPKGLLLASGSEAVAEAFDGKLAELLATLGATGAEGEAVKLPAPAGVKAPLVLAVGLGEAEQGHSLETLRKAAGVAARTLAGTKKAALALPAGSAEEIEAVALGALLGSYSYSAYRNGDGKAPVGELTVLTERKGSKDAKAAVERAAAIGEEINRARDLVNTAPNDLNPKSFAAIALAAGKEHSLKVEVLDEKALAKGGFGGLLGVGTGSANPPRLVKVAYTHPKAKATVALVGKGITYDSGGISLKPAGHNETMKCDMAGAAAVFATVVAAKRLGLQVNITAWLALAENMPSGTATRPGDVLRMYGGKTVEVLNTDAEGRLVLADAIVRAGEEQPDVIVDVATLTGAMVLALGNRTFGVMANSDELRDRLHATAEAAGEQSWPMPLPAELRKGMTETTIADLANMGERMGGGLVAGLFLKEFVAEGIDWAHLDIAGPAFHEGGPFGYTPRGGTGSAIRTLIRFAEDTAANGAV
ncbi:MULTISPECIES: leucyl aminopeptidase [unclassified Kitasatospora]|uniref:leucyl aminopeptidase n=1 Tax=unclassified Kitasatospora TaxID=2633591 RepID=UPI00070D2C7B|nr:MULTISPECIES: leucyl aminopeptidase [unclassified Kitasatospora]KQV16798.1 aminopeptidase [Kitasatospora sp. Root107]KRB73754.1 aminopeptidase [Kitasatospora sp. Root187]